MEWLQSILAVVPLWVKILIMVAMSIICTMFPSPIPLADISFITVLEQYNSVYWVILIALIIAITDTAFAVITYLLGDKLVKKLIKKDKQKEKLERIKSKIQNNKWADVWVFLASATPIPFTLTIYASSVLEYKKDKFAVLIGIGRIVKYMVIGFAFYYGYNLVIK